MSIIRKLSLFAVFFLLFIFFASCSQRELGFSGNNDTGLPDIKDVNPEEYELVKNIRISASDTKTWGGFGWVREAEDSIYTIRDDVQETCYKGPENKDVIITLDIYTTYRKTLPLSYLKIGHNQKDRTEFIVSLSDNCQRDPVFSAKTTFEKMLNLENRYAGCIKIKFRSPEGFEICSLSLTTSEFIRPYEPASGGNPTDKRYGVIEGFYGVRWSDTEREKIFYTLGSYGLGMYVYAPKNEPKHREKWRENYTQEEMKRFSELNRKAGGYGVDFYYAISPFIDFEYTGSSDYDTLLKKLKFFTDYGIKNFAIFADDIEMEKEIKVDAELGKTHTNITNNIYSALKSVSPDIKLLFVGTVYSDERVFSFEDGYGYLSEISKLNPEIEIFWTGLKTSGATITKEDTRLFTEITGRKPLIWDNFWANDGGDGFLANLYLSDYTGRETDIAEHIRGIGINPLIQGSLSRLNIMRFGRWKSNKISGNWAEDELKWFGLKYTNCETSLRHTEKYLMLLSDIYNGNSNRIIRFSELDSALDNLYAALKTTDKTNIIENTVTLYGIFARMFVLQSILYNSNIDSELFDEIFFPSEKIRLDALTGIYALQFLLSKLSGPPDYTLEKKMKASLEKASMQRFVYSAGRISKFAEYVSNTTFENISGIRIPEIKEKIPQDCTSGREIIFRPFANTVNIGVYGLPDKYFTIQKDEIRFNIPFSGNYSIVIIGYNSEGINISPGNLVCK